MFKKEDEVIVSSVPVGTLLLSNTGLTVKVLEQTDTGSSVKVLTSGIKINIPSGNKLFVWSQENATDIKQLEKMGVADFAPVSDNQPIQVEEVIQPPTQTTATEQKTEETVPKEPTAEEIEDSEETAPVETAPEETAPEENETEITTNQEDNMSEQTEQKEKTPSMGDVILPMLKEKTHTATAIAEKVKAVFPEKYQDEKAFKKLVQQIKGPRVYNAKKAGHDVAVVAEAKTE